MKLSKLSVDLIVMGGGHDRSILILSIEIIATLSRSYFTILSSLSLLVAYSLSHMDSRKMQEKRILFVRVT